MVPSDDETPEVAPDPDVAEATTDALLDLQRMESVLVRAELEHPDAAAPEEVRRLRYLLRFAHLTEFQPGAAKAHRRVKGRPEVSLGPEIEELRTRVIAELRGPLLEERDAGTSLARAIAALSGLEQVVEQTRRSVHDRHAGELSAHELDAELATKALVNVAGGGGGAGYVYIGAYLRLWEAGIVPAYVVGASIGAVVGLFAARSRDPAWEEYLLRARTLTAGELFSPPTRQRRYGFPGLLRLGLERAFGPLFANASGDPMRIRDLEIPYEAVVAGVRRRSYDQLPARFRQPAGGARASVAEDAEGSPGIISRARLGAAVARRMWQVAAFFDPRVVKPVALGSEELTAGLRAVDAAGFSAAIPGVLHYDLLDPDPISALALDSLFEREELAALVDGGVIANVPAALTWNRLQTGRLGTRNAFLLAFDCFHPQWDPKHLWLQPIAQAVALQHARDSRYVDWMIRFEPTLSPVTIVPGPEAIDLAVQWGRAAVEPLLPMIERSLEPVWWDVAPGSWTDRWRSLRG